MSQREAARLAAARAGATCQHCGKPFDPIAAGVRFCSHRCRQRAWHKARPAKERLAAKRAAIPARPCLWCATWFTPKTIEFKGRTIRFCSQSCGTKFQRANRGAGPQAVKAGSAEARDVLPTRMEPVEALTAAMVD